MKKGLGNILTLALGLINTILLIVIIFTVLPANKKTATLVDKICNIVDLSTDGSKEPEDDGTVGIDDIDTIQVYFGDAETTQTVATLGDNSTYLKVSLFLNLNKKSEDYSKYSSGIDSKMSLISSTVLATISKYTKSTISQAALENDICAAVNELFGSSDLVYSVSISQYVVQ